MKILVTGGSGLLGTRLIPRLIISGHQVFALVRSAPALEKVWDLGAQPIDGALDNDIPLVLPKLDAVVHAAAMFRFSGSIQPFFRTNVDGTAKLLAAAERAGAAHFVHISAAGVIMDESGSPIRYADESAPTYSRHFSAYLASKAQAEKIVLTANTPDFRTVILRPPALWGAGDQFSSGILHAIRARKFVFIDRGDYVFSTCHVDNLVEAVQCALKYPKGGRVFFITDQQVQTFREFVASIASMHDLSIENLFSIPYWLASTTGRSMDAAWAMLRRNDDPPLSRSLVRMIGREFWVSDNAARQDLGYVGKMFQSRGRLSCECVHS
ncbi:NAD-dependent epimerase/dehydratase family protein [Acidithiobacillus thiooxidans]|uniref:NAD-dependent epimerase/dehydratase family protein n=1 Tax=Acidithiobacillus TaxID=119977 RepID=UPI0004E1830C|nr:MULTISPECIES: NAD-dependent epimerase/dehydratase family protein [Acidithiobacillus]MBU2835050.1 NAD-dependent epimerase/dehydratase family protein [Acidithiobacillus thiooxidans]MDA8176786.1 NAD-dependent epimerase/dehydratase family protein [Acidithiobacillus sp.]